MNQKTELLLPAGSAEALETAFLYGADAVYAGMPGLSLRANGGFDRETTVCAVERTHALGKKIYLTLNSFSKNADADRLDEFAKFAAKIRPDALIVSDAGVFAFMRKSVPDIALHVSTQANVGSWLTADFWKGMGAKACVLSRETSFAEICEIKRRVSGLKIEMFIHGAMCMSYSGRCLLSAFMTGRSANRGVCAHACRWKYRLYLEEEQRPNVFLPIEEDDRGSYILNSRDLCLMGKLDKILAANIDLLKIEGRNKTPYYVAQTAAAYRRAIDDWYADPQNWKPDAYQADLDTLQNRGWTTGFFDGVNAEMQNFTDTASVSDWRNAGAVARWTADGMEMTLCHKLTAGDELVFLPPARREKIVVKVPFVIDGFTKKRVDTLSPGKKGQTVLLAREFFDSDASAFLPPLTVARIRA